MQAVSCIAFLAFLHVSQFTVSLLGKYDPDTHLSLSDVSLDNRHAPEVVHLHIKESKGSWQIRSLHIHIPRMDSSSVCSVQSVLLYLAIRGKQPGPLFIQSDNTMLTRKCFTSAFKDIISKLNLDIHFYTTNSFIIGAATSAK